MSSAEQPRCSSFQGRTRDDGPPDGASLCAGDATSFVFPRLSSCLAAWGLGSRRKAIKVPAFPSRGSLVPHPSPLHGNGEERRDKELRPVSGTAVYIGKRCFENDALNACVRRVADEHESRSLAGKRHRFC